MNSQVSGPVMERAGPADLDRLASILAPAFADEPMAMWIFRSPRNLEAGLKVMIREIYAPRGLMLTDRERKSAALWLPPGASGAMNLLGKLSFAAAMVGRGTALPIFRGLSLETLHNSHKPALPHAYLFMVGVSPEGQGQGLGSAIIKAGMAQAATGGEPLFLETSKPDLVGYYQRFGFQVTAERTISRKGPPVWFMTHPGAG